MAEKIYADLGGKFRCAYDESGSIGKRYYRHDEIGTPFCVTVDFDSVEKGIVTVRHRDTKVQEKVEASKLNSYLEDALSQWTLKV
jgi:glycyl-tRNA synthetase